MRAQRERENSTRSVSSLYRDHRYPVGIAGSAAIAVAACGRHRATTPDPLRGGAFRII